MGRLIVAALLKHMKQREAKYIFLVNWIKDRIGTRELRPGEKLYSENELSEMFDLSRQTVRHAIGILEAEGLVTAAQGKGFYVNAQDSEMLREQHLRKVETALMEAIQAAQVAGITPGELEETLRTLLKMEEEA